MLAHSDQSGDLIDFMKFEVSEWDFPDFLARLPARFCSSASPWLHFQALNHIKPQRERRDGVGPGRLGGISSFYAVKETAANVGRCVCIKCVIRTSRMQTVS